MTCDILTPGHIKAIRWLEERCNKLIIGLLTDEALVGYKNNVVCFEDRLFIVKELAKNVVAQRSLSPEKNIKKYRPDAIASGDGWENEELKVIERYKLKKIEIKLKGEKNEKKYGSSNIKRKVVSLYKKGKKP